MKLSEDALFLVFSDLDGSLLDHDNYGYQAALPQLRELQKLQVPVILATSKTRAEVEDLRHELDNPHPFIVENGAAIFIPEGYFADRPPTTVERDGYWICELSAARSKWLTLLDNMRVEFAGEFENFSQMGALGIARMTNLPLDAAERANCREYSEPVKWLGEAQRKADFIAALHTGGASVLSGGRFLSVSGDCDKGRALVWLRNRYMDARHGVSCHDLAIGDSANDCAMLEAAETALLVRSPVHAFPVLGRSAGLIHSEKFGPAGWAAGVRCWLDSYHQPKECE